MLRNFARRRLTIDAVSPCRLSVTYGEGGKTAEVPSIWLLDNTREDFNEISMQREADRYGVGEGFLTEPHINAASLSNTGELVVTWADGSENRYEKSWITAQLDAVADKTLPTTHAGDTAFPPSSILWDNTTLMPENFPKAKYDDVMSGDAGCHEWLRQIKAYGFCLLEGCPEGFEDFSVEDVAKKAANYPRNSIFGGVWSFEAGYEHADTAYTDKALPAHVDSCYCYDPPGLQMLHCVEYKATGGLSTLVDGFKALALLKKDHPEYYKVLQETVLPFSYHDTTTGIELKNQTPTIVPHYDGTVKQLRYNDCDRDPLPLTTPFPFYQAWDKLTQYIKHPDATITFQLLPGTVLIFDNWRLLHGRTVFTGKRKLVGCYMNMEDFESRYRVCEKAAAM